MFIHSILDVKIFNQNVCCSFYVMLEETYNKRKIGGFWSDRQRLQIFVVL